MILWKRKTSLSFYNVVLHFKLKLSSLVVVAVVVAVAVTVTVVWQRQSVYFFYFIFFVVVVARNTLHKGLWEERSRLSFGVDFKL